MKEIKLKVIKCSGDQKIIFEQFGWAHEKCLTELLPGACFYGESGSIFIGVTSSNQNWENW